MDERLVATLDNLTLIQKKFETLASHSLTGTGFHETKRETVVCIDELCKHLHFLGSFTLEGLEKQRQDVDTLYSCLEASHTVHF